MSIVKNIFFALAFLPLIFTGGARAMGPDAAGNDDCLAAYEQAALPYWPLVNDIVQYKTLFDHYHALCLKKHPAAVAAVQPYADRLAAQTDIDINAAYRVMAAIIETELPKSVPPACRGDTTARETLKTDFREAMDAQRRVTGKRLATSALNADICLDLARMRTEALKLLGPAPQHPLFEAAALRRAVKPGPERADGAAYKTYRKALQNLSQNTPAEKKPN